MILGKCKDCAWWDCVGTNMGICQRFPPAFYRRSEDNMFWVQPETYKNIKCAEFIQKEV
mgnify:CR=1 FL=1